jgi:hypothetical protein
MSFITDEFIVTLRKNIESVFDMLRKLSAHQSIQDNQLKDLNERIKRFETVVYNISDAFSIGNNGKTQ